MDAVLLLKIVGAAVTFALGIWVGLGTPGLKRSKPSRDWQSSDRLRATWINRVFFRMDREDRSFGSGLISPGQEPDEEQQEADSEDSSSVVRLRRTFER